MKSQLAKFVAVLSLSVVGSLLVVDFAPGQATFVSSRLDLAFQIQAGGLGPIADDFDPVFDETSFSDNVQASDTASSGSANAEANGAFDFSSSLIDASGDLLAEAFDMASASASVDWELSFEIPSGIAFYSADTILFGTVDSFGAGSPNTSLRLISSSGAELFAIDEDTFLPGSDFQAHGVLGPDTYTLQANLDSSIASSDEGNTVIASAEFDLSLVLRRPELPLVFSCPATDIAPIGICVEAIQPTGPIYVLSGFVLAQGSAEPIPYSLEDAEIEIQTNQQIDLGNGPVNVDLALVEATFDELRDHFPDELFELGTRVLTTLAFEPGSLQGNEQPEDLPIASLLVGFVELFDEGGNLIASNELTPVPEPGGVVLALLASLPCLSRQR